MDIKSDDTFLFPKNRPKVTYDIAILCKTQYPLIEINTIDSFLTDVPPCFTIKLIAL